MSKSIHICMFQFIVYIFHFIVCIFQNPKETAMTFEVIVAAIKTALTGWDEFDSNFYFNELVESGRFHYSYFYPIFIVARLTDAIMNKEGLADQLTLAHRLEEDLAWLVDSLRHRQNQDVWKELLQQVRAQVDETANEIKGAVFEEDPGNPFKMDVVSSEEVKEAPTSEEEHEHKEEDEPVVKRMRFSTNAEIGRSGMKEDRSGEERVILERQGQDDGDDDEPAIKKICLFNTIRGTDGIMAVDSKGEADSGFGKEIEEPTLKKRKLSEMEPKTGIFGKYRDNIIDIRDKDVIIMKEPEPDIDTKQVDFHKFPTNVICRCWPSLSRASGRRTRTGMLEVADSPSSDLQMGQSFFKRKTFTVYLTCLQVL